jgi:phosphonate transport system ATP-binding protein
MIMVRNLSKRFSPGEALLNNISFQIDRGELIGLIGAGGSGKTTLLRCIAQKVKWDEGELIVDGKNITQLSLTDKLKLRRDWVFLAEKESFNPRRTALKTVLAGSAWRTPLWRLLIGKASMDEHMSGMDYLEKVGLLNRANHKMEQLSGGERQRAAIARAMMHGAKWIVIDEPVSGLDPTTAEGVMADLRELCLKHQTTLICSLHDVRLAEKYATRIWGLSGGRIVLDIQARRLTEREKQLIF